MSRLKTSIDQIRVAAISPPAALAAKAATSTIPTIVALDPIRIGLVTNLSRPEGNLTETYILNQDLAAKRFGLLRELIPNAGLIGVLVHSTTPDLASQLNGLQTAARAVGQPIVMADVGTESEIEAAFSRRGRLLFWATSSSSRNAAVSSIWPPGTACRPSIISATLPTRAA